MHFEESKKQIQNNIKQSWDNLRWSNMLDIQVSEEEKKMK